MLAFKGKKIRILSPAQQILHNCSHGIRWHAVSPIRWVVDVMQILEKRADSIEWELLISEAAERKLTMIMFQALNFLKSQFAADIPENVLHKLAMMPKDSKELRFFEMATSPPGFADLERKWLAHSYSLGKDSLFRKIVLFPEFLKNIWHLTSVYQIPLYAMKKIRSKLSQSSASPGRDRGPTRSRPLGAGAAEPSPSSLPEGPRNAE